MKITNSMENQHLDVMLKLAFELEETREIQRLLDEPVPAFSREEMQAAAYVLDKAYASIDSQRRKTTLHKVCNHACSVTKVFMKVAACIALIVVIAGPIAFAESSTFRAKVMQLLIRFDEEQGTVHFTLEEDKELSFCVPEGWRGDYFLSGISEGFSIYEFDPLFCQIEYRDTRNRVFSFGEYSEYATSIQGTDKANISYEFINGHEACILEAYSQYGDTYIVSITWSNDERWFVLRTYNMELSEALSIAKGVRKIK